MTLKKIIHNKTIFIITSLIRKIKQAFSAGNTNLYRTPHLQVLPIAKLRNCVFLPNRYTILNKLKKDAIIAEVGVLAGDFSKEILLRCTPKELHLIDLYNCDDVVNFKRFSAKEHEEYIRNEFTKEVKEGLVHINKAISWEALAKFPDAYFDMIYIDAAHDYESVKKDLEEAGRALKKDGIIVMNDYIMYDHMAHSKYGVVEATNEFILANRFEMVYFAFHPQLFCDVAIKRSNPQAI